MRRRDAFQLRICDTVLVLFRHNAKSLNAHEERQTTALKFATRLHLPHAIVVRLHVRKINVVILIPEVAATVGV